MGHRINVWIQRSLAPTGVIVASVLLLLKVSAAEILAILLSLLILSMTVMILADPGPRAKGLVEKIMRHRGH